MPFGDGVRRSATTVDIAGPVLLPVSDRGSGLTVMEPRPLPTDHPLLGLVTVVVTPCAGLDRPDVPGKRQQRRFAVLDVLDGRRL
jgi:hypothetical protein